jgi:hypothetical protein
LRHLLDPVPLAIRRTCALLCALAIGAWVRPASAQEDALTSEEAEPTDLSTAVEMIHALQTRLDAVEAQLASTHGQPITAHGTAVEPEEPEHGRATEAEPAPAQFTVGGWVEAYYAWNFNEPSNGITDQRGFDNRHNSANLSIAAIDTHWDWEGINGRITLQWGSTPATYYLAETSTPVAGSSIGAQNIGLWQFVQQAYVGYHVPGTGLTVQGGLFLSPVGVEAMAVRDNFLYSRSTLFFGFPFYHTGFRASYEVDSTLTFTVWLINGWNTVTDNNREKSFILSASWSPSSAVSLSFNYVSGIERPTGDTARGGTYVGNLADNAWRHVFDLNGTITPTEWLAFQSQVTGGFEPNTFGIERFLAGMLDVRVRPIDWLAIAARGDFFWDHVATNALGSSSPIFYPAEWVSSFTAGIELRPHDHISFRLEFRHDQAADWACNGAVQTGCAYFQGTVAGDGTTMATQWVRNAASQNTVTIGTTGWF